MAEEPEVLGKTTLASGKFVALQRIEWRDAHGEKKQWDSAERVRDAGAVLIIAELIPSKRIVLIRQYRPPAEKYVVEFPAGLIEPGEKPEAAAARELREETGYVATELTVFSPAYTSPGLSNENVCMVLARIDETAEENRHPITEFDPSEMIETILVDKNDLEDFYKRECASGTAFDAKLAAYILARK